MRNIHDKDLSVYSAAGQLLSAVATLQPKVHPAAASLSHCWTALDAISPVEAGMSCLSVYWHWHRSCWIGLSAEAPFMPICTAAFQAMPDVPCQPAVTTVKGHGLLAQASWQKVALPCRVHMRGLPTQNINHIAPLMQPSNLAIYHALQ